MNINIILSVFLVFDSLINIFLVKRLQKENKQLKSENLELRKFKLESEA